MRGTCDGKYTERNRKVMNTKTTVIAAIFLLFAGCGIFNPYKSDFQCPGGVKGKCVSVTDAMEESKNGAPQGINGNNGNDKPSKYTRKNDKAANLTNSDPRDIYQQEMAKKLTKYIRQPDTPFLAPPTVMRVLILPYKASPKDLYSERYVYFIVDEPQWVVGASKYGEESNDMILEKPGVPTKQK